MSIYLGIDLGTTYSTVAAARNGRVELLSLGTRGAAVPSVVFVRDDGPPLVGEAAEARAQGDPSRFAREFKRRLGDPTPLILGGVPMGAERLSGFVLTYLVERATERLGEAPAGIVLTHPASYTQYRLDLLGEAVHHAGLSNVRLLAEPRAAAIHYAADNRVQDGETVAVYDFGGGTFDTALVRRRGDDFELIGEPQGIDRFGGIDIDLAVFDYVCDEAADLIGGLDAEEPVNRAMLARLRADCRLAKERLSADTETVVPVATPVGARDVTVTRRVLESMIRFRLADTVQAVDRAVRTAGLNQSDVSRVLLVGGSSRIPLVRSLIAESFGRPVSVDADPESSIALGAAAAAARWADGGAAAEPVAETPSAPAPAPSAPAPAAAAAFAAPSVPVIPVVPADEVAAPPTVPTDVEPATSAPPAAAEVTVPPAAATAAPPTSAPPPPAPPERPGTVASPVPPAKASQEIPTTPGARAAEPSTPRRRWWIVAVTAVVALLVVGVVVVLATRDSGSDDSNSSGGEASSVEPTGSATEVTGDPGTASSRTGDIQIGDDVGLTPPDTLSFSPMSTSDLEAVRDLVADAAGDDLALIAGSMLVDEQSSTKGAVVRFQAGGGPLSDSTVTAIIDAVVGEQSVTDHETLEIDGVEGTKFERDDGSVGWIGPAEGDVVMMTLVADAAQFLEADLQSLAANNIGTSDTTSTVDTTATVDTPSGPTTTVAFDIDNVTLGDVNSDGPTINAPAGFHFEPLNQTQIGLQRSLAEVVGPEAASLRSVLGTPFTTDDTSIQIGGISMFVGDGSEAFQQQAIETLVATGTDPQPLDVGQFSGTVITRGNGTPAWVGAYQDAVIMVGMDVGDPDMATMLSGLDAANS